MFNTTLALGLSCTVNTVEKMTGLTMIRGRAFTLVAVVIFLITFGAMWGPFYFMGSEGQLFLYPIALFLILVVLASPLSVSSSP
jgi:Ca2+/Na+ antiporter